MLDGLALVAELSVDELLVVALGVEALGAADEVDADGSALVAEPAAGGAAALAAPAPWALTCA